MDDYGYFGNGSTGYAHYTQAVKDAGGGGGNRGGGDGKGGCLTLILMVFMVLLLVGAVLAIV